MRIESSGAFSLQLFPGGHFYLQDAQPQLLAAVQTPHNRAFFWATRNGLQGRDFPR